MRIKAAGTVIATVLIGTGLGMVTAAPANASGRTCDYSVRSERDGGALVGRVPAPTGNCTLREGNSGDAVKALQSTLWKCYGQNVSRDGQFGPRTKAALIHAQREAGAGADGIFGPETFGKLKWAYFKSNGTDVQCHRYGR
ncbi:peptidoglycan-binding protein [Nocardia sp. NPDC127579]|uniref:peptidoglycan-binding domain-containing protein n=1 Tax=Nocardia sp. NPDC127579 TaxID=3345402 RepID=UPI00362C84FD